MAAKPKRKRIAPGEPGAAATIAPPRLARWMKIVWWVICLAVIAWWAWSAEPVRHPAAGEQDRETLFFGIMAALSFPAGLAWVLALPRVLTSLPLAAVDLALLPWYTQAVAAWFGCTVLGYIQWFWLLPHVLSMKSADE